VEKKLFCLEKILGKRLADDDRAPLLNAYFLAGKEKRPVQQ